MDLVLLKQALHLFKRIRFACIPTATGRTKYINKHKHLFSSVGNQLFWQPRKIPPQPELISIGNNVKVSSGVQFITHDLISLMLNTREHSDLYEDFNGCIKIDDNVMIGANSLIMPNVHICSDVIIAAGSIVTKDINSSGVWGGVPAKYLKSFEDFIKKREGYDSSNSEESLWKIFDVNHQKNLNNR